MLGQQTLFFCAVALTVLVAGSVDALVSSNGSTYLRPSFATYPGTAAGVVFMAIMAQTGVAPHLSTAAFAVPWALAQVLSSEAYGVTTVRERVKRASLAAACGGLGVLATLERNY